MLQFIYKIDQTILFFIQENLHFEILDKLMIAVTFLTDGGLIWIALAIALVIIKKTRKIGVALIAALIISSIMGEIVLKNIIQRPRPYEDFPNIKLLINESSKFSFPSGHTTVSFAAAFVLNRSNKKFSFLFYGFAVIVGFSRIYLFMHYPTDVMAGIILGLFCGALTMWIFGKMAKQKSKSEL
jgi:undecaprenyl-diphosphatase